MKKPDVQDLIKKNPQIDPTVLEKNQRMIEDIKARGVGRPYELELPYGGRRLSVAGSMSGGHIAGRLRNG
ncbi:MAG: hypothetical protein RID91_19765 [Azospirillaceae bacterium]